MNVVRCDWSAPTPKKLARSVVRLCVPRIQQLSALHVNWAAAGAPVMASRAPSRAATLTPLSTDGRCHRWWSWWCSSRAPRTGRAMSSTTVRPHRRAGRLEPSWRTGGGPHRRSPPSLQASTTARPTIVRWTARTFADPRIRAATTTPSWWEPARLAPPPRCCSPAGGCGCWRSTGPGTAATRSPHALMRGAVSRLHRWGLLDRIWRAGTPVITRASFRYGPDVIDVDVPATPGIPGLAAPGAPCSIRSSSMPPSRRAPRCTTTPRCWRSSPTSTARARGARLRMGDGIRVTVTTDLLIGADGLHSLVARHLGGSDHPPGRARHRLRAPLRHRARGAGRRVPVGVRRRRRRRVIPTNDGTWCVFAAVPPHRFTRSQAIPARSSATCVRRDRPLPRASVRRRPTWAIRPGPAREGSSASRPARVGARGDAGYFKDPFAAHGISDASGMPSC